jgi:hypothetical protein
MGKTGVRKDLSYITKLLRGCKSRFVLTTVIIVMAIIANPTAAHIQLTGISHDNTAVKSSLAKWTIMVYLNGDCDLEAAAITDFLEISSVGSNSNVKILVLFDRVKRRSLGRFKL